MVKAIREFESHRFRQFSLKINNLDDFLIFIPLKIPLKAKAANFSLWPLCFLGLALSRSKYGSILLPGHFYLVCSGERLSGSACPQGIVQALGPDDRRKWQFRYLERREQLRQRRRGDRNASMAGSSYRWRTKKPSMGLLAKKAAW